MTAREQHVYHAATCFEVAWYLAHRSREPGYEASFEVATVTTMDSQEPACAVMMATCWLLNEVGANMQLTL